MEFLYFALLIAWAVLSLFYAARAYFCIDRTQSLEDFHFSGVMFMLTLIWVELRI